LRQYCGRETCAVRRESAIVEKNIAERQATHTEKRGRKGGRTQKETTKQHKETEGQDLKETSIQLEILGN
jgi:hypothetical protein